MVKISIGLLDCANKWQITNVHVQMVINYSSCSYPRHVYITLDAHSNKCRMYPQTWTQQWAVFHNKTFPWHLPDIWSISQHSYDNCQI